MLQDTHSLGIHQYHPRFLLYLLLTVVLAHEVVDMYALDIVQRAPDKVLYGQSRLVWLKGSPGRGKSAIVKSICIQLRDSDISIISFFFNKNGADQPASADRFAGTIAHQMARFYECIHH